MNASLLAKNLNVTICKAIDATRKRIVNATLTIGEQRAKNDTN